MTAESSELYREGLRLFNEEEFFECHEVLEELWSETRGDEKKFLQGLIQAAVALFHFGNENFGGANGQLFTLVLSKPIKQATLREAIATVAAAGSGSWKDNRESARRAAAR